MALVVGNTAAWACPDNLVDCCPGGFFHVWDDGGTDDPSPRASCATAADAPAAPPYAHTLP